MTTRVYTVSTVGLEGRQIEVEVDMSNGLPSTIIVGLPDKAVQESKERIRAAITQSGFEIPPKRFAINLAPADESKTGTGFDLPLAVGMLHTMGIIKTIPESILFLGELALDARIRGIGGVLNACIWARSNGWTTICVPQDNYHEASLIDGITIIPCSTLIELIAHLNNETSIEPVKTITDEELEHYYDTHTSVDGLLPNDMAYVRGQHVAKRAVEIAASGGHNVLLVGQPGSGKTLLAKSYQTILPRLTREEVIEVTRVYSSAGMIQSHHIMHKRPFRAPHHSSSHIALVGGGSKLRPGEISLAHRGVLFLDEFPEFQRESIEALRQPLEDGYITISRASGSVKYPSRFYLLAAANPSPSGYDKDDTSSGARTSNPAALERYKQKLSGPVLDRIDIQVTMNRPDKSELQSTELSESSTHIQKRVQQARDIQNIRFAQESITTNAEMSLAHVKKYCILTESCKTLLDTAIDTYGLTGRSYIRILKVSRTIADLENFEHIKEEHILEALQYRDKW